MRLIWIDYCDCDSLDYFPELWAKINYQTIIWRPICRTIPWIQPIYSFYFEFIKPKTWVDWTSISLPKTEYTFFLMLIYFSRWKQLLQKKENTNNSSIQETKQNNNKKTKNDCNFFYHFYSFMEEIIRKRPASSYHINSCNNFVYLHLSRKNININLFWIVFLILWDFEFQSKSRIITVIKLFLEKNETKEIKK